MAHNTLFEQLFGIKIVKRRVVRRRRVRVHAKSTAHSRANFLVHKDRALLLVTERIAYFNAVYGFTFKKVFIRNQTTRWGSCSSRGNLSFNYAIVLISPHLADYIIVHELCHLGEFNHSAKFWALVEKTMLDYVTFRAELRKIRIHELNGVK